MKLAQEVPPNPAIQTTVKTMGPHITTMVYLRIVIRLGSTFLFMGLEA